MSTYKSHRRIAFALFCAIISASFAMTGCSDNKGAESSQENSKKVSAGDSVSSKVSVDEEDTDSSYDDSGAVRITLNKTSAAVEGEGAKAEGSTVKVSKAGTYKIIGSLDDGNIVVEAGKNDTVRLVLDNASIKCSSAPAIYASKCKKVIIVLGDNTKNSLSDGEGYVKDEDSPDAAVFVGDDLTILGSGSLDVTGNAKNGITSKDTLRITGGNISVTAANHGITGRDDVHISGGAIKVEAKDGDGIRSTYSDNDDENKGHIYIEKASIDVTSANDGIQAEKELTVKDGEIKITSGGGAKEINKTDNKNPWSNKNNSKDQSDEESLKGMKAGTKLSIAGGKAEISSADDSLHSGGDITVSGGELTLSSGDDGMHADETISVTGGKINITGSYEGIEARDISISGGTADITASDDGINASGGNDQSGFGGMDRDMTFGPGRGGQRPDGSSRPDDTQTNDDQTNNTLTDNKKSDTEKSEASQEGSAKESSGKEKKTEEASKDETASSILKISGGTIYINAQGDGVDSNGDLEFTGGTVVVNGTTSGGNGILDHGGACSYDGGTVIGAGTSDMLELPDEDSKQNMIAVLFDQSQKAGTLVYITDSSKNVIAAMSPEKDFGCFILGSEKLEAGEKYSVYVGGTVKGDGIHGYYKDASVSGGTLYTEFTLPDSKVTYVNSDGVTEHSGGMGGKQPGGSFQPPEMPDGAEPPQAPGGDFQPGQRPDNGGETGENGSV